MDSNDDAFAKSPDSERQEGPISASMASRIRQVIDDTNATLDALHNHTLQIARKLGIPCDAECDYTQYLLANFENLSHLQRSVLLALIPKETLDKSFIQVYEKFKNSYEVIPPKLSNCLELMLKRAHR